MAKKNKNVTVNDIAKAVGMSASTVSRALANHAKISDKTKETIWKAAKKLGYLPNIPVYLQQAQSKIIVLLVDGSQVFETQRFVNVVQANLEKDSYQVLIKYISDNEYEAAQSFEKLAKLEVAGFISLLTGKQHLKQTIQLATEYNIPTVVVNNAENSAPFVNIAVDYFNGMSLVINHLERTGVQKPVLINNPEYVSAEALEKSFLASISASNMQAEPLILNVGDSFKELKFEVEQLREQQPGVDAFIVYNYNKAIQLHYLLTSNKLHIPEDVKIIAFGNENANEYLYPKITGVSYSVTEMAEMTALKMKEAIKNKITENQLIINQVKLIIRSSTMGV